LAQKLNALAIHSNMVLCASGNCLEQRGPVFVADRNLWVGPQAGFAYEPVSDSRTLTQDHIRRRLVDAVVHQKRVANDPSHYVRTSCFSGHGFFSFRGFKKGARAGLWV